jgi:hypothetical protein
LQFREQNLQKILKIPRNARDIGGGYSCDESYNFCKWIVESAKIPKSVIKPATWWLSSTEQDILDEMFGDKYWIYFRSRADIVYINGS